VAKASDKTYTNFQLPNEVVSELDEIASELQDELGFVVSRAKTIQFITKTYRDAKASKVQQNT
jgi:transcriptional regulatory protein LevR